MCIKYGNGKLSTVKALMSMSLNSIIADVFDMELDNIKQELNLRSDIHMSDQQQSELTAMVVEYFDDLRVDFSHIKTLGELFDLVLEQEFKDVSANTF